jgi:integrase
VSSAKPLHRSTDNLTLRKYGEKAKLPVAVHPHIHPHILRHACAMPAALPSPTTVRTLA